MVGLIFCGDLKYCPYIKRYVERLEMSKVDYTVYFWNRSGFGLNLADNYKYYASASALAKSKIGKLIDFYKFRKWLLDILERDDPSRVIVLSTLTGVLIGKKLYGGKRPYIFDIRDYSYEYIKPFYSVEKKVIENSEFTAISSKGFESFLPEHNYVIAHNFNRRDIIGNVAFRKHDGKLQFVWNGVIRYFEFQKQYLDALKNDDRFEIVFHGDGPELELYRSYCQENGFNNAIFTGSYNNVNKAELLATADILNNCYGYTQNAGNKLKYAISNRFYDGMIYHIPQLVEQDGYKPRWAKESGIGTSIVADDTLADTLYQYYMSIDAEKFDTDCEKTLEKVINEDDRYIQRIDEFIK